MSKVAVVAHARKSFGGGLPELRQVLAAEGVIDPLWYEVKKSRKAPKHARRAAAEGADLMLEHQPTDVLGSLLFSALWLTATSLLIKPNADSRRSEKRPGPVRRAGLTHGQAVAQPANSRTGPA